MSNRAWRVGGRLHVRCETCGSEGTCSSNTTMHFDATAQQLRDTFARAVSSRHNLFLAALNDMQRENTMVEKYDPARKAFEADMAEIIKSWPGQQGVTETVDVCPWCAAALGATVEQDQPSAT